MTKFELGLSSRLGTHLVRDGEVVIGMALAGFGLCQMPRSPVQTYIDQGELTLLLPERCQAETPIYALWPATRSLLPRVRIIVDELVRRAEAREV